MNPKNTLSLTEARKKFFDIANEVQKPGVYYALTENGRPKAVILSYEEFDSLMETLEVYKDFPDLEKDLQEVASDIKSGEYKKYPTLEQVMKEYGYVVAEKTKHPYAISNNIQAKRKKRAK